MLQLFGWVDMGPLPLPWDHAVRAAKEVCHDLTGPLPSSVSTCMWGLWLFIPDENVPPGSRGDVPSFILSVHSMGGDGLSVQGDVVEDEGSLDDGDVVSGLQLQS